MKKNITIATFGFLLLVLIIGGPVTSSTTGGSPKNLPKNEADFAACLGELGDRVPRPIQLRFLTAYDICINVDDGTIGLDENRCVETITQDVLVSSLDAPDICKAIHIMVHEYEEGRGLQAI
ncbi:hypothetical protein TIFTF001_020774 [Ficus carica]|uniref:Uncharacterized protein n=1 Tax=Ficus carica TaxID=3494 RepID=A0AA88AJ92_FICCA|nr:hypothetical protein TIFTF001_020774 [Ficus carica]